MLSNKIAVTEPDNRSLHFAALASTPLRHCWRLRPSGAGPVRRAGRVGGQFPMEDLPDGSDDHGRLVSGQRRDGRAGRLSPAVEPGSLVGGVLLGLVGVGLLYGVLQMGKENKGWAQLE